MSIRNPEQARTSLAKALSAQGRNQVWLAGILGVSQPSVSAWLTGRSKPEGAYRIALERLFSIPCDAWLSIDERRLLRSLPSTGTDD